MKKMKTLSLLFLAVIMSSTGLVSCIDEDLDPVVASIYANQALLIASQAALNDAKANYENAKAAVDNAYAEETMANIEIAQNESAADINDQEEVLRLAKAVNDELIAAALIKLDSAQLVWEADMVALESAIAEAQVTLANTLLGKYKTAINAAQTLIGVQMVKSAWVEEQKLLVVVGDSISYDSYFAQQDVVLNGLEADLASKEMTVTELEAALADPTSSAARSTELQEMIAANEELMTADSIAIAELEITYQPLMERVHEWYDAYQDFTDARDEMMYAKEDYETAEYDLEYAEMDLEMYNDMLADYDNIVAGLEAAIVTAQGVVDAAVIAEGITEAAEDAAETAEGTDQGELTAAQTALSTLEGIIATLEGSLNTAAANLSGQQASVDGGLAAALVSSTAGDVTTAQNDLSLAQANYELWRDRFESKNPNVENGGYHWEDNGTGVVLGDDIKGLQTDDVWPAVATYVLVNSWLNGGVDINVADGLDGTLLAALPGGGVVYTPGFNFSDAQVAAASPNGAIAYYVEVGTDDEAWVNLDEFQVATTALGNENIFDNPPVANDPMSFETGAWAALWNAELANLNAIKAEADELQILADLQTIYDDLKVIYEDELDLLDAAQQLVADTTADLAITAAAEDVAEAADDVADTALYYANFDLTDAQADLADLATEEEIAEDIITQEYNVANYKALLGYATVTVSELTAAFEEMKAIIDAGGDDSEAVIAELAAIYNEIQDLEDNTNALDMMNDMSQYVISAILLDNADIEDLLVAAMDAVDTCEILIEMQEILIASAVIDLEAVQAVIDRTDAYIESLQDQIDALNDMADAYYALMEAALQA